MSNYDSSQDTIQHIARVRELLELCVENIQSRQAVHDKSKLEAPEKPVFDEMTPLLKGSTYGSPEYKGFLSRMQVALDHHYKHNSHHPEHYERYICGLCGVLDLPRDTPAQYPDSNYRWCPNCYPDGYPGFFETALVKTVGIDGMSLLDLIEMLCDWKAAGERHADGSMSRSLQINKERFQVSPQLQSILENTARELGWI
jgi:hypothetical protein